MAGSRYVAIFRTTLPRAQGIIRDFEIDAKAKELGPERIAVWGPSLDDIGATGLEEICRSERLPLLRVVDRSSRGRQ